MEGVGRTESASWSAFPFPLGSLRGWANILYASCISASSEAEILFSFASLERRWAGSAGAEAAARVRFGGWKVRLAYTYWSLGSRMLTMMRKV